jgi:hypothetical protein
MQTAGGVASVGLKVNRHVGWIKVCSVYAKYIVGSIAIGRINKGDFTIQSAYME